MNIGEGTTPIASHVTRKQIQRCPKGTHRNQQTGNCEPKSTTLKKRTRPNCPKGTRRNKKTGLCETTAKKKELEKKHQDTPKKIEPQEIKKSITPTKLESQEMKKSITPKKIEPLEMKKLIAETMDLSKPVGVKKNPMSVEERVRLYEAKQTKAAEATPKVWNDEFVAVLGELEAIMNRKGESHRARAYKTGQETIMSISENITDVSQLDGMKGIGPKIISKLKEYQTTGKVQALERLKADPMSLLTKVYGIGGKKAQQLVSEGVTTIEELRQNQKLLNDKQIIGLKYFEDIEKRIPRKEIEEFKKVFSKIFEKVKTSGSKFEIVGSFRRGASNSGDIDIIVTNDNNDKAIFGTFFKALETEGIVIESLTSGSTKKLTIGVIPGGTPRRLDFLWAPAPEYAFAVLYFTGSKAFNVVMRQHALSLGFSLNEHGLYQMDAGVKGDKLNLEFPTEQSIFEFLGLEYIEPQNRRDGRDIIPRKDAAVQEEKPPKNLVIKKNKTLKKTPANSVHTDIAEFQKKGIDYIKSLSEEKLNKILQDTNAAYYNQKSLMTDGEYDIIKEYVEERYPKNTIVKNIGAPVEKEKVKLPYFMASMDKIKPDTGAIDKWKTKYKGPYVMSAKLDGISGLFSTESDTPKLYTRGNGKVGQDISYLIPHLGLPVDVPGITIRGELLIKKSTFDKKYKGTFANARNLVAGIVNSKTGNQDKYADLDFVVYEVIVPELKPSEQMEYITSLSNVIPVVTETRATVDNDYLSEKLLAWRGGYEYEIDGVIVINDSIYPRTDKNPKHAFAFKMVLSDQIVEAKVVNVLWTPSKHGLLKPRIQIEPVTIGGATIEYATAFNAGFVEENRIGVGAVVRLVRSGDVIPHILAVVTPAEKPLMPDVQWTWNDTHVDIILSEYADSDIVRQKTIAAFYKGLEVDGLGPGNVKRLVDAGYNTIPKVGNMTVDDFLKIEGFKTKTATKIHDSIQNKLHHASLEKLMGVSGIFGRGMGEKKAVIVLQAYPNILTDTGTTQDIAEKLRNVEGVAAKSATQFAKKIPEFVLLMKEMGLDDVLKAGAAEVQYDETNPLYGKHIVMTGFRDKDLEKQIKATGAKLGTAVSKSTDMVIVKSLDDTSGKAEKAKELAVPLITIEQFNTQYL
jgi:DNA ligase (NAD+)